MKKNLFAKLTSFVLVVMLAFTMIPSGIAFANTTAFEFVVTADKYSAKTDETVTVTVTVNGEFKDIAGIQVGIVYDPSVMSVDDSNTGTKREPRYDNAIDAEWFDDNNPYDYLGICEALDFGVINKADENDNTKKIFGVLFKTEDEDLYINEECELYGAESVVVAKLKFKALKDIDSVKAAISLGETRYYTDISKISGTTALSFVQLPDINMSKVESANTSIAAIPETVTYADKAAVESARAAFNALNDAEKALVTGADKISAAESVIASIQENINNAEALIDAIGDVEFTQDCKLKIEDARAAYDALADDDEKAAVENYAELTAAESRYSELKAEAEQNAANIAAAQEVDDKIVLIGTVVYTADSKALIDDANAAYEALTPQQKPLVTKKDILDAAVAKYNELKQQITTLNSALDALDAEKITLSDKESIVKLRQDYEALDSYQVKEVSADGLAKLADCEQKIIVLEARKEKIDAVIEKIEAIGTVTLESDAEITEARNAYDALEDDEKAEVTNYETLTNAETTLADLGKAKAVSDKIAKIGTVTLDSGDVIKEAEDAYALLTQTQKNYVEGYDVLTTARETYNTLVSNKAAADEVIAAINALPEPQEVTKDNVDNVASRAASARTSYENLPNKSLVADTYVDALAAVEEACNTVYNDLAAAKAVEDLINKIGTVSLNSIIKIEEAESEYEELSQIQKDYVTNYDILTSARSTYDALKADQDAVDAVQDAIAAIGEVTLDSEPDIIAAEEAYLALDDSLKSRVENYKALTDARATYEQLVASKARVDYVIGLIDDLGEITLKSIAKIEAAEKAYGLLSVAEQESVENYYILLDARETYNELKATADKEAADQAAAEGVVSLIEEIGEVTLERENAITAARSAYDALTDDQKEIVNTLNKLYILEEAEEQLRQLKEEKTQVDAVIALINEIGEVTYPDSKDAIDAAQYAYDELSDDLKSRVTNKGILDNAIAKYASLEADYNAVQNVVALIDAIGTVEYTVEVKERIDTAQNAYLALREELRAEVTNAQTLEDAKITYEELKPTYSATKEAVEEYGVYVTVFDNIAPGKKVTLGGIDAQMVTVGEDTYYVILSDEALNPDEVVVEEGITTEFVMGDITGDGTVTALDALAVNQKSANMDVDAYINEPMTFVKTDINGSGTITAYDALMIARMSLGIDVAVRFVTGN